MTEGHTIRQSLRRTLRDQRAALSAAELASASDLVCRRVATLTAFVRARSLALYAASRGEIDPAALHAFARARRVSVAFPRVESEQPARLAFHRVDDLVQLERGRYDILAPPESLPAVDAGTLDLVIVPGIAFDLAGHRLGYGRGYYDAALGIAPRALRIGLCHSFQFVPHIPRREGDEPVDLVVMPDRVHVSQEEIQ